MKREAKKANADSRPRREQPRNTEAKAKTSAKASVKASAQSKLPAAFSAELLFAVLALVTAGITLWVTVFRHADFLVETADLNPFFTTSDFWSACLGRAGGGVVYL